MFKKNRSANKGFSLVELIVVVAIMAVLTAVLAPQYIKYVENSRQAKDNSAAEEVRHAVEIALTDEAVYNSLPSPSGSPAVDAVVEVVVEDETAYTFTGFAAGGEDDLEEALQASVGNLVDFTSKLRDTKTYTITITIDKDDPSKITVIGSWA